MPLTKDELRALLSDIENERIERTLSTDNTKKMQEAICSFANDIRNTKQPGYFLIGAHDNGDLDGMTFTDEQQAQAVSTKAVWHVIAAIYFRSGKTGVKVLPRTVNKIIDYFTEASKLHDIEKIDLYLHNNPFLTDIQLQQHSEFMRSMLKSFRKSSKKPALFA